MNINEAIEQLKYYQNKPYVPTVRKVCDIALETIESQQQENEQLRAQNSLKWQVIKNMAVQFPECPFCGAKDEERHKESCSLYKALMDAVDYHNPADVEALKKARDVFRTIKNQYIFEPNTVQNALDEALAEIDKALIATETECNCRTHP